MKDVVVKLNSLVCWKCGTADQFIEKRTMRAKAIGGFAALLTAKKLKCKVCGEYNKMGNAQGQPVFEKPQLSPVDLPADQVAANLARIRAELKRDKGK